ncbi:MAG: DNA polymerase III subunit gamma/tau [Chitinophagaceae bacterium]
MDKFIVSARKYRPQNFNTVVGQSHITTTLKNAIKNNQLAHAFLFCGPRGVGKTTCARILAKTINCTQQTPEGEACNTCQSCVSFDAGNSMNIHELDAASNNSVEDIRSLVEQVRFAPQAGQYKVYIVDEVHMLSASAFNAFLKTLEEPPSYAIFILATTEKHKILPTILSRCQIFDFKRITNNDTVEHLQEIADKENIAADKASLQIIAQKSEGCMRDALSILDKIVSFTNGAVNYQNTLEHLNILDHDYYFKLLEYLLQQDMAGAMILYDQINKKGFEGDLVLNGFAEFIRNILVCKDARAAQLLDVVEGLQEKYMSVAKNVQTSFLVSTLNMLNEAEIHYKMARNKRLHVELVLIKLNFLQQAIELSVNEAGSVIKKKRIDGPTAIKFNPIPSIQIKPTATNAKLYVEEPKPIAKTAANSSKPADTIPITTAVNNTVAQPTNSSQNSTENTSNQPIVEASKKSLLDALREKYGDRYSIQVVEDPIAVDASNLQEKWNEFIQQLKAANKHTQANAFSLASVHVIDETTFTIRVDSALQQRFIEQEKMLLLDFFQKQYHSKNISFDFVIEEGEKEAIPLHLQLNSKQKFEYLAKQYPLLLQLKNNLKLDIEM